MADGAPFSLWDRHGDGLRVRLDCPGRFLWNTFDAAPLSERILAGLIHLDLV